MIVFHAGMEKAGSSSIQRWLSRTTQVLASERDIHLMRIVRSSSDGRFAVVPCSDSRTNSLLVGVQPVARWQRKEPNERRADARQVVEQLALAAQARGTIVLTSEAYARPFWRGEEAFLSELDELARAHQVRVAYYVRPQHTAMEAAWRQWGFRSPLAPSTFLRRRIRKFRYLETLEQVRQLAPHVSFEMRAFRDDLLVGRDVVVDFASTFLGADDLVPGPTEERRANTGYPLDLVVLLRDGKDRFWTWQGDNDKLDQLRDVVTRWDVPESEQVRRSRRVLQAFCHRCFEPSNQRLIGNLGWRTESFVPPVDDAVADAVADDLTALDELWSSTASATIRELVFCALSELLPSSPRDGSPLERPTADGSETDLDTSRRAQRAG